MSVTDAAIDGISQMIFAGELQPGERLPREADLAVRLGLSRNSLREAVRALSLLHVLDVRQGDGTYVTSLEPAKLLEALTFTVELQRDDTVLQFLEVRRILEPAAAARAATSMSKAEVTALGEHLDKLDEDPEVDALVENDLEFHRRIAAGSDNQVLCSLIESLSGPTQRVRLWRGLTQEAAVSRTVAEHRAIWSSIASRQPEIAASWMTVHVAGVEQWLREAVGS